MARDPGEPLTKISINLPTWALEIIKRHHPQGYQIKLKELVGEYARALENNETMEYLEQTDD